jgi:hypothetical protein
LHRVVLAVTSPFVEGRVDILVIVP